MHRSVVIWAAALLLLLSSCDPARVYEQNVDFEESNWSIEDAPVFEFEITDTTQTYNVYFNVRYNLQYDFYNLYIRNQLVGPDNTVLSSQLHELLLMDPKTGKPLGNGSSDVYDLQARALKSIKLPKVGKYKLKLTQYMRRDPLPNILAVGVRVEQNTAK
ncbi:gliding motility lipoprotein GldH [Pontibacter silvestris]|uniref:Gliding motility lipoprotein GldH n=1 Tax=Pontibacter silvestris TaxID=2305183 RepID=A0ABW4WTV1_9BACT|nr:gliding motility lipoprotein GldH [Pontibacter silvestris]MCC9137294.1 gliding motility lipoprotein GldH [Pontibacter silvestris]